MARETLERNGSFAWTMTSSRQQPYCVGVSSIGVKSLNQAWRISRRELFLHDVVFFYSRSPGRFGHPQVPEYLGAHARFHHVERVQYVNRVHTQGFEQPHFCPLAPENAFFVHCNCLLRTPAERWEKIRKYEQIEPLSTFKLADEYLPELYDLAYHNAKCDGLDEFADLFDALVPIQWSAALPAFDSETLDLINREVSHFRELISSSRLDRPVKSADDLYGCVTSHVGFGGRSPNCSARSVNVRLAMLFGTMKSSLGRPVRLRGTENRHKPPRKP